MPVYTDTAKLDEVTAKLGAYPPLVFAGEARRLKAELTERPVTCKLFSHLLGPAPALSRNLGDMTVDLFFADFDLKSLCNFVHNKEYSKLLCRLHLAACSKLFHLRIDLLALQSTHQ